MIATQFRIDLTPEQTEKIRELWAKHHGQEGGSIICQPRWIVPPDGKGYLIGCVLDPEETQRLLETLDQTNQRRLVRN